jgi:hypothetical protein
MIFMAKNNIKALRLWAREYLQGRVVTPAAFGRPIEFTGGGIKEFLNQPHKHFYDKNELIKEMPDVLVKAEYKGVTQYKNRISHIFEIEIKGDKSWLIANEEEKKDRINFYSISDSEKILQVTKK